jgi:chemotaxis-related protein WspB
MLMLLLKIGEINYAIKSAQVIEIVPKIILKSIPKMPSYISGVFNYRGSPVPVVDISELILNKPANNSLSTRILLIRYNVPSSNIEHLLGIAAEGIADTIQVEESAIKPSGLYAMQAPYLAELITSVEPMIQILDVQKLLNEKISQSLFCKPDTLL